ncbi:MAG: Flp pilus assembly complex ATPase component TadA [Candidatus Omnitrophica bacterium]|nr:Flp pilus assembly complex ATPase component TadA [Candidatus Omnitrophota bacterium]
MNNERLGHILLKQGLIQPAQLDFCLSVQKNNGRQKLGQVLCHYDFVDEASIARAIACQVGWEVFEGDYVADENMVSFFGLDFLFERMVFPVKSNQGIIFVLSRTDDTQTTDMISQKMNQPMIFYIGLESSLRKALEALSKHRKDQGTKLNQAAAIEERLNQWFEDCLNQAITQSASDIHIESSQKVIEIRFRIDGILSFVQALPLKCLARLVNIIFHKAEVTISDFGHFHDARFLHRYLNRPVDVRVSHIPSVYGSSLVLRLLDKSKTVTDLSALGYGPQPWQLIQKNLVKPDGITLIVGPTGCGKTTTLYAILNHLKSIDCKIITIEDPVEIQLPLMTQVQINEKRGISFGQAVRAFLRHDPDIVLIGEIRDQLTAQEALRAAMTGHQVFATLHTNRALGAILRLHDLGLPLTHMADHLSMIIAQRLVRKLCPVCKQKKKLYKSNLLEYQAKYLNEQEQEVFVASGCNTCRNGFLGQTVVAEVLSINEVAGEFIARGDLVGLKKFIREDRKPTMIDDAKRLIAEGITTIEEALRVLG